MPNAHAPVRFSDAYPDEFAEWSDIPEQENMTPQHQCMAAIIDDPAVMHAAKAVIDSILADESERWRGEDRLARLDAVWQFFGRASHLSEEQPPGSHLRRQDDAAAWRAVRRKKQVGQRIMGEYERVMAALAGKVTLGCVQAMRDFQKTCGESCPVRLARVPATTHTHHAAQLLRIRTERLHDDG